MPEQGKVFMRAASTEATAGFAKRIVQTPGVCGGLPRIAGTRFPVWVLLSYRNRGMSDSELLEQFPALSRIDLAAAWRFAKQQPALAKRRK
jgi:uncharacterized protein (DUF433 family)